MLVKTAVSVCEPLPPCLVYCNIGLQQTGLITVYRDKTIAQKQKPDVIVVLSDDLGHVTCPVCRPASAMTIISRIT